ncbi:MAG: hypothetical protein Q4F02_03280 [Candidatus Saccharibacteria bacterium]|nr:hypothetical protein [Candidatus Saccharibacteria bacterium]
MSMETGFQLHAGLATLEDAEKWRGEPSPDDIKHQEATEALGVVAREAASSEEQEASNTDDT